MNLTSSGDYSDSTLTSIRGCDSIANLNFILSNVSGITNPKKHIRSINLTDVLGRKSNQSRRNVLLYIDQNGTIEKRISIE